jgi:sugar lactone lactonase YvrE
MRVFALLGLFLIFAFLGQEVFAETEMTGWLRVTDQYSADPGPHSYLVFFQPDDQSIAYQLNPQTMSVSVLDWSGERVKVTVDYSQSDMPSAYTLNQNQQFLEITSIGLIDTPSQLSIENEPPQPLVVNARSVTLLSKYSDIVTTPAEDPGTGPGQFKSIRDVAVDSSGNVYTIEFGTSSANGNRVQKFDSNGNFVFKFGKFGSGDGEFTFPRGIAVDGSGNIYVVDYNADRVQKFDSNGVFLLKFGSSGSGDGQFSFPHGIAVDSSNNIYVADSGNHRIQKFNSTGGHLQNIGSAGLEDGQFNSPLGVALDSSDNLYVVQAGNTRVTKFDSNGDFVLKFGSTGSGDGQFNTPMGIDVDSSGNIFVSDTGNNRIQKFNSTGGHLLTFGSLGSGDSQFDAPEGIAAGSIYVADKNNDRVKIFNSTGGFESSIGFDGSLPHDQSYYFDLFYNSTGSLKNYYDTSSYGNYIWNGEVSGWESVNGTVSDYATNPPDFDQMITDAIDAHETNVDFCNPAPVTNLILIFNERVLAGTPPVNTAFGSIGTWANVPDNQVPWPTDDGCDITISVSWEPDNGGFFCCGQTLDRGIGVTAHELGHNLEFDHTPPPPGLWSVGIGDPYHDVNSVMSGNRDLEGPSALIMGQRDDAGWVSAQNKITIANGTSSTVTLDFSNEPQDGPNHQMAIIPLLDGTSYIVEGHQEGLFNDTPQDRQGAIIYKKIPGGNQYSYLLNSQDRLAEYTLVATNGTDAESDFDKAILELGQSYVNATHSVTITTQSMNSTSVTLFVSNNASADSDSDGIPDGTDNCPDDSNAGQEDMDSDGSGDVCDSLNEITSDTIVSSSVTILGNLIVQNNSLLTINSGVTVTIPSGSNITIESGSGVLIKSGGTLNIVS